MKRLENFVDGKLVAPMGGRYMPIVNPADGQPYVEAPLSGTLDVDAACEGAALAFQSCLGDAEQWLQALPAR